MNIVIAHSFSDAILAKICAALPGHRVAQFPRLAEAPTAALADAEVLYAGVRLHALTPDAVPRLRWVQSNYAGVDPLIAHPLFADRRLLLTTAAGVHAIHMGEYAIMMMLALGHRLPRAFAMMRAKTWDRDSYAYMPLELHGATLGLVGYGALGESIAQRGMALGMRVVATVSSRSAGADPRIEFVDRGGLDDLLARADFIVVCVPLSPATRRLLDAARLAHIRPTAFLINISRGDVIDEAALAQALAARRIGGAALDVFATEPLADDSPLWGLDNVILTPHIAGQSAHYQDRVSDLFIDNVRRFANGEPLRNQVDLARGY